MSGSEPQNFENRLPGPTIFLLQAFSCKTVSLNPGAPGPATNLFQAGCCCCYSRLNVATAIFWLAIQLNRYSTQQEVNRRCDLPLVRCRSGLLNRDGETVGISRTWILALQSNGLRAGKIGCWNCHLQVRIVDEGGGSGRSIPERNRSRQETRS